MDTTTRGLLDDSAGLHEVGDEDLESREKPKVTYICGGNSTLFLM
jgi:hypothetical protein